MAEEAQTSEQEIEECGLRKNFGGKEAVTGIDLEVAAVSLAGLIGPNRAGHASNARDNFCFEVTLGYRRVERGR